MLIAAVFLRNQLGKSLPFKLDSKICCPFQFFTRIKMSYSLFRLFEIQKELCMLHLDYEKSND